MKKLLLILLCLPMIGFGQCISGNCENGQGTYTYTKGEKYFGEFKDGKKHGYGIIDWNDGFKYEGEWKDGLLHGQGTMTYADGTIEEGLWENHKFLGQ